VRSRLHRHLSTQQLTIHHFRHQIERLGTKADTQIPLHMRLSLKRPTWGVVCTTSAPLILVQAFAAFHLRAGARRVAIYDDLCQYGSHLRTSSSDSVTVVCCNNSYWKHKGTKPADHRVRQTYNANHAIGLLGVDYIAHLDVDEFLVSRSSAVDKQLASHWRPATQAFRIPPCEPLYRRIPKTLSEVWQADAFKLRFPPGEKGVKMAEEIHGARGRLLRRGLQGHAVGKVMMQAREGLSLGIHRGFYNRKPPALSNNHDLLVCHFFAMGISDWMSKLERRLTPARISSESESRRQFLNLFDSAKQNGTSAISSLYEAWNVCSEHALERLQTAGYLFRVDLEIAEALRERYPGAQMKILEQALPERPKERFDSHSSQCPHT
jgi:hypothetical protein